jgi:hypothetical protein
MSQFSQGQVIILMIVFAVGFVIGAAITWILAGREKNKETPSSPEQDAWLKLREQYAERTSLWQNRATGKLVVRIDEHMLDRQDQLSDLQRKSLNAMLKEWLGWLGFPVSLPSAPPQVEPVQGAGVKAPIILPNPVGTGQIEASSARPSAPLKTADEAAAAIVGQAAAKPAVEKAKSIVEQIDEILQSKLKNSPELKKGVKLVEDPKEGVVVWVGLDHFAGVDAVTDPEVKSLLRAAAAEWEQQHTVGKR